MMEVGLALVLVGAALLVAEAHVPGGVLGVFGGIALAGGAALAIAGAGGGLALAWPRSSAPWRSPEPGWPSPRASRSPRGRLRAASGARRSAGAPAWCAAGPATAARCSSTARCGERAAAGRGRRELDAGDAVVVERVSGLTLAVRRAEDWEEHRDRSRADRRGRRRRWRSSALAGASVRVLREYERGVVFRLGRVIELKGPGVALLVPGVDRMVRVSLRTVTLRIPPQEVITRDNVPVRVAAVAYFRVIDPNLSVLEIEDFRARDAADRPDDAALRARQGGARRAAVRARAAQREPPADHRRADGAVGHQGHHRRDQGRRDPRARCSTRSPARPRPSATGAPR